jgi:hypothetical protein
LLVGFHFNKSILVVAMKENQPKEDGLRLEVSPNAEEIQPLSSTTLYLGTIAELAVGGTKGVAGMNFINLDRLDDVFLCHSAFFMVPFLLTVAKLEPFQVSAITVSIIVEIRPYRIDFDIM